MDLLFQIGISNACFAFALAPLATLVGSTTRRPQLAYTLWLLVFVKLVTPPVIYVPLPEFVAPTNSPAILDVGQLDTRLGEAIGKLPSGDAVVAMARPTQVWATLEACWTEAKPWLAMIWTLGTGLVIAWSIWRVVQFDRMLTANSEPAPDELKSVARRLARRLKLKTLPKLCLTSANLSPMVWWVGGPVRVIIPRSLLDEMKSDEWQWILAHELAHVRRRDYFVRWLEWLACAIFWWNPLVWWAQRSLRSCEELCCDAFVLSRLNPDCHAYAESILKTVESLVCPAVRPPAMASEINSGGFLERRVVMIMSGNTLKETSRFLQSCVAALAIGVFPLGLAYGQEIEKVEKKLQESVEKQHLTQEHADAMMATLKNLRDRGSDRATDHGGDLATDGERARKAYASAAAELKKSLDDGVISKDDMEKRLSELHAAIAERLKSAASLQYQESTEKYAQAAAEMEKLADEGKIPGEDLEKRQAEMKKMLAGNRYSSGEASLTLARDQYSRAAEELKKMFAEGEVKDEEIENRMAVIRRMINESRSNRTEKISDGTDNARAEKFRAIAENIHAAVEAGEMTSENGRKKLEATRAQMAEYDRAKNDRTSTEKASEMEKFAERIKTAVESGKMTKDESEAKMKELKAFMKSRGRASESSDDSDAKKKLELEGIVQKIRLAVTQGKLTNEEAAAKIKTLKEEAKKKQEAEAKSKKRGDEK